MYCSDTVNSVLCVMSFGNGAVEHFLQSGFLANIIFGVAPAIGWRPDARGSSNGYDVCCNGSSSCHLAVFLHVHVHLLSCDTHLYPQEPLASSPESVHPFYAEVCALLTSIEEGRRLGLKRQPLAAAIAAGRDWARDALTNAVRSKDVQTLDLALTVARKVGLDKSELSVALTALANVRATVKVVETLNKLMKEASRCRRERIAAKAQSGQTSPRLKLAEEAQSKANRAIVSWARDEIPNELRRRVHSRRFLFASGPEYDADEAPALCLAVALMKSLGFGNVAGDARDQFHKQVMTEEEMQLAIKGWRMAWKGKVCTGIEFMANSSSDEPIVLATIAGGPECQWEVEEIRSKIVPSFQNVQLEMKHFDHWTDFVSFFLHLPEGLLKDRA